ncbi:hypothetical protein BCY84_22399 [Trypanosoma cruzi cruzi]|uniref:Uncharacterized protein n=1 Tax=Trypanosoma cruzi TaxID=5693 RepID=A0A2V2UWB9_TRYCR|nr:hypothetical protein BCY84_22399 [Trypanosoma cruzi cruzi]PWU87556.1 hypothetical protein C4B63_89g58 [Trypanosoma cruzi]
MGNESATRYVAAVTIQRWIKRRFEVTRAMRLLGILRVLQDEAKGKRTVTPLLEDLRSPTGVGMATTADGSDGGVSSSQAVKMLLELAVMYAERLHSENYTRQLMLSSHEPQSRGAGEEDKRAVEQYDTTRRLLILSDEVLRQLVLDVRDKSKQQGLQRGCGLQQCLDAPCITWLSHLFCKSQEVEEAWRARPFWWSLRHNLLDTCVATNHVGVGKLDDVPPLPQPPILRRGKSLAVEGGAQKLHPDGNKEKGDPKLDTSSGTDDDDDDGDKDDDDDDNSEDFYSDEKYYEKKKEQEQATRARVMSFLQMDDSSAATRGKDAAEEAAARDSYMELFGEVRDVLFPTLNAMKAMSTEVATAAVKDTSNVSNCCIVCELQDEAGGLVRCPCGSWVHVDCAMSVSSGVPRCSQFCHFSV